MPTSAGPRQPSRGPGRPPKPQGDSSSALARLGGLVRCLRGERGLTLMSLGELTGYSWQHLGAVERGQVVPSEAVVVACERALAAGGQLAALFPAVVREQASHRHSREAARRGDAMRTDLDVEWARLGAAARRPSAVSVPVVEELEQITDRQRVLYHELSSAEILVSVEAHLSLLVSLMRGTQPEPLRHRIASAAVEAAGFAAWLWFDLGDQFKMGALYDMAGDLFAEAGNPALAAYVTGYRALAAEAWGLGREAVHQAEAARNRAPAGTSQLARSWLSAVGANTLALTGDRAAHSTCSARRATISTRRRAKRNGCTTSITVPWPRTGVSVISGLDRRARRWPRSKPGSRRCHGAATDVAHSWRSAWPKPA